MTNSLLRFLLVGLTALSSAALAAQAPAPDRNIVVMNPEAPYIQAISPLVWWSIALSVIVLAGTGGALWYVVHKYRARGDETSEPPQFHGNNALELILFAVPVAMVAVLTILTANTINRVNEIPKTGTLKVDVTGYQFWWDFQYKDLEIRNSNELVVPVGTPIEMTVGANDVIHSFWITSLGAKRDAIPGQKAQFVLTAPRPGIYYGQCTELCGASHANMLFRVIALEPAEFDAFVAEARAFAPAPETAAKLGSTEVLAAAPGTAPAGSGAQQRDTNDPSTAPATRNEPSKSARVLPGQNLAEGRALFEQNCSACHAVKGTNARGAIGPDMSYMGSRSTVGAGIFQNQPAKLREWILRAPRLKPGIKMPAYDGSDSTVKVLSEAQVDAIADYLESNRLKSLNLSKFQGQEK